MRALTIKQPWAWAITAGHKTLENRSWRPPAALIGQRIAIHAGGALDAAGIEWIEREIGLRVPTTLESGAIVAIARIVEVIEEDPSPWFFGPLAWRLDDVETLPKAIRCRGNLGLWSCDAALARERA